MKTEETTENALKIEGVLIPIEDITPGDLVRSHDGRYHSVVRTIRKRYRGTMVGLKHANSPHTLWVTADHRVLCQQRKRSFGANRSWKHVPVPHFERARSLRREPTPAEKRLWKRLKGNQLGVKFRKQHPIGPYIVDFYSRDCHLVIEADGDSHFIGDGPEYDIQRDAYLRSHGVKVLRFTNREIAQQTEAVMEQIAEAVTETEPADTPLRQWRRADSLEVGDIAYFGYDATPVVVTDLSYQETDEEVFDLEVENAHSYLTEVCMVHNCGSGTGQLAGARGRQASAAQRHTQHLGSRRRRFETF